MAAAHAVPLLVEIPVLLAERWPGKLVGGFAKPLLATGKTRIVELSIPRCRLMLRKAGRSMPEPGAFRLLACTDAADRQPLAMVIGL